MLTLVGEIKKQSVGLSKVRKFVKDINPGKINKMESAKDRYLKDVFPDILIS